MYIGFLERFKTENEQIDLKTSPRKGHKNKKKKTFIETMRIEVYNV